MNVDTGQMRWNNRCSESFNQEPPSCRRPRTSSLRSIESSPVALVAGAVIIAVLLAVALYLIVDLRGRVSSLEAGEQRQSAETKVIEDKLHLTNKNIEAGMEALGSKVGMTRGRACQADG